MLSSAITLVSKASCISSVLISVAWSRRCGYGGIENKDVDRTQPLQDVGDVVVVGNRSYEMARSRRREDSFKACLCFLLRARRSGDDGDTSYASFDEGLSEAVSHAVCAANDRDRLAHSIEVVVFGDLLVSSSNDTP